jgi:uncharacterized membrane protein YtjA (UPF0391 family)
MLGWALMFLVVAIICAILGFGGIASDLASTARFAFFVFVLLFAFTLMLTVMGVTFSAI